jgi:hypothetical protein
MSVDIREAWDSVKKISELKFEILLHGHGIPVLKNGDEKVRKLLEGK